MPIELLNVLSTNAAHDIRLPAIQTARQPYLLANADTTGPANCFQTKEMGRNSMIFFLLWNKIWWSCQLKDLDA